ncbi:unnamed protein product [Macrosiphum euphorbiae]|uniref:Transposable element P transposase n=1 Tax=Macrosiphum euphorbiae TaxID=13131 RepID=A0AAV0XTI5_9HEMI|nr:unnamed protein product [Macrosiphum euphorbiae]
MKVSLAASILSSSVADALTYCSKSLKLPEFENCEGTIEFCRNMNNIFDFLNTRNFLSKSPYKRPLSEKNIEQCNSFIDFSISYLSSLKDKDHVPITKSIRKTGFNGLIICLKSVKQLLVDLVLSGKMKFLLTYKLSQDHLELLFSTIRARGGFSNNPTAWQVEAAMKRILIHSEIMTSSGANCLPQDTTTILFVSSNIKKQNEIENEYIDMLCAK